MGGPGGSPHLSPQQPACPFPIISYPPFLPPDEGDEGDEGDDGDDIDKL